jgi:hypothetical protein
MFDPETADPMEILAVSHSMLTSLRKFDEAEVDPVCRGQISLSPIEECRIVQYLRVQRNVDSMIALAHVAHFQALSMLARSIFELTVDLRLMPSVPDAPERMKCFQSLESLKAARAAIERSNEPNGSPVSKRLSDFEATREISIEARANQLWGPKFNFITHWSGLKLKQRVSQIADDQISHVYVYTYRTMSWQTHPGLQGSYGLPANAFPTIANSALNLAVFAYLEVLRLMISTLGLEKHDALIGAKLNLAHTLPYTDHDAEELELRRSLGL